jgi:DNA adenine methylase
VIRYPGSKAKIAKAIMRHFPSEVMDALWQRDIDYREPFFGGGAVGLALLERLPSRARIWINDKDWGVAALWKSVREQPEELVALVERFQPSVETFHRYKEEDGRTDLDHVQSGFRKLVLHQTSWGGLGSMAGGPLGGRNQSSEYNVQCRWRAARHVLDIRENSRLLNRFSSVRVTSADFSELISEAPATAFIYADPPYYEKGGELYRHSMTDEDHRRLSALLHTCRAPWVLSYDDAPFVRDLYGWASISSVELTYTVAIAKQRRRKNSELIIAPAAERGRREATA